MNEDTTLLDRVAFDPRTGLAPAVVQSDVDGRVLMLAYMNREALRRTLDGGRVTFWSRSRRELWRKGDTSGNWLETISVRTDCDGDALLVRALPHGPSCHTGAESCFDAGDAARKGATSGAASVASDHDGARALSHALEAILAVVAERDRDRPEGSHTASLLAAGPAAPARKVAEEAVEVLVAALEEPDRLDEESADLLYHLVVLWRAVGLEAADVGRVLARRRAGGEAPPGEGGGAS